MQFFSVLGRVGLGLNPIIIFGAVFHISLLLLMETKNKVRINLYLIGIYLLEVSKQVLCWKTDPLFLFWGQ